MTTFFLHAPVFETVIVKNVAVLVDVLRLEGSYQLPAIIQKHVEERVYAGKFRSVLMVIFFIQVAQHLTECNHCNEFKDPIRYEPTVHRSEN